jgi:hypothetical protein
VEAACPNPGSCPTPSARSAAECALQREVVGWLDDASKQLAKSGVDARYRLVWAGTLALIERNDLQTSLKELLKTTMGPGSVLHQRKKNVPADVALVIVSEGALNGVARPLSRTTAVNAQGDTAIAIVKRRAGYQNVVSHELAHLLGAGHSNGDYGVCDASMAWVKMIGAHLYRTIAATEKGESREYFSSPIPHGSYASPMGSDREDNALTLQLTRHYAAQWETGSAPDFVPVCAAGPAPTDRRDGGSVRP